MTKIDTHQHFWTFRPENYSWIDASMAALQRDFGPADLEPELQAAGVDGTLLVEARGHLQETDNLLAIAARTPFVRGVVGWLPLTEPGVPALLERYAARPELRGLRHWLGPVSDPDYMFGSDLHRGIGLLHGFGLTYDLGIWAPQLHGMPAFVDRHPNQIFVLDHFGKPFIREGKLEPWRKELLELARRPNVYCKISGLATEAKLDSWTLADLTPFLASALEAFTPQRLMFGSDWPVCTLATSYSRWSQTIDTWLQKLSAPERARILGGTAHEVYRL
jgi:L-fucono-1,5-lactonase